MDAAGQIAKSLVSTVELTVPGKWHDALKLHEETLKKVQELFGRNHSCSHCFAHILASVLTVQGRWQQAECILRKLLQLTRAKQNRLYHHSTITCMDNLANALQYQGKWQEAEEMRRKVLEAELRKLGEEHQHNLARMNNLAIVLEEQGKWPEAEDLHRKVLDTLRRTLGEDHPDTSGSMNNLANVLYEQGKWQEAEDLHRKVLEGIGEDHPDTLFSMNNLANVLQEQGKWQEAEDLHRRVLEGIGEDHPDTLFSMNNLANVLQDQGKWQEAEILHGKVLEARRRTLGEDHPDTLSSRHNLASVLRERGQADPQFRQSEDQKFHRGRLAEAISSARASLEGMQTRVTDEHHPDLVRGRYFLAKLLVQSGSLEDAEQLLRGLVETTLQEECFLLILTSQVIPLLVSVLEEMGQTDEAEEWQEVLEELLLQVPEDAQRGDTSTLDEFSSEEEKRLFEEWSTSTEDELFLRDYVENKNEVTDEMDEFVEKFTSSDQNGSAERSQVGTESSLHLASSSSG